MSVSTAANVTSAEGRMIAKGSFFYLVRLLQSKSYDDDAPVIDAEGVVSRYEDDTPVTFGDLRNCRVDNAIRADGSEGTDYPLIHQLTQSEASGAIAWLTEKPAKQAKGNFRPKAGKAKAEPRVQQREAVPAKPEMDLEAMIAKAVAAALGTAKPERTPGHTKVKREVPAKPEITVLGSFKPGDVIEVNGVAVQISPDGKRLNRTIA